MMETWKNSMHSYAAPRKLVKTRKVEKEKSIPINNDHLDDVNYARPSLGPQVTDDFESNVAWAMAWDKRRKIHVCWFSRVLRKLRRKNQNTALY